MLKPRLGGGQFLTHCGTLMVDLLGEMTQDAHLTNRWVFSLQFFCNDVCLSHEHQNTKIM